MSSSASRFQQTIFSLVLALLFLVPVLSATKEFYVSPSGKDRNPGTLKQPFRTLMRARDAVRKFRSQNPKYADTVAVVLRGGRYFIEKPLLLTETDGGTASSPTLYASFPGEHPVVSGGIEVTGWKPVMLDGKQVLGAPFPLKGKPIPAVRDLWVNGYRRTPARFPNSGYLRVDSVPDVTGKTEWQDGQKSFMPQSGWLPAHANLSGSEVVVMNRWVESHLPVDRYEPSKNLLMFTRRSVFRLENNDPFYVINARSLLDTAGEWYYDARRAMLYYVPMENEQATSLDAVVPIHAQLVQVRGNLETGSYVEHLLIREIEFSHTTWHFPNGETDARNKDAGGFVQAATGVPAAIEWEGVRHSAIERCVLSHLGTYGIALTEGCSGNRISECDIHDLGAGGIKIGSKTIAANYTRRSSDNLVINNHIYDGGRTFHSAIGVWVGQSPRNRFIHNHIHDFYYSGFSIGWTWGYGPADAQGTIVEMNHVHHIGILSSGDGPILADLGGIYTLGNHRGTVIRNNVFHDIAARVYGGWGIYLDEGTTSARVENNVVYRTTHGGFHQNYGKENVIRNNIFAFGNLQQVQRSRAEGHASFAFENNIFLWKEGKLFEGNLGDGDAVFDRNLYWPMKGEFRAGSLTFEEWQKAGFDTHSQIADPLFVDPESGDFTLRKGSPAPVLGFKPIDVSAALSDVPMREPGDQDKSSSNIHRLIYNNDGSNILMAYDTLTPKRAYERIDPYANSGVTTFIHNVNPGQNMGYASSAAAMYHWDPPQKLRRRPGENSAST